jgi:hypothetical protein
VSKKPTGDSYETWPAEKLRGYQTTLLKNIGRSQLYGFEWIFSTNQLDAVNRALAAK